ncbi:hypothetical protein [Methylopila sp. 73B]|uniref:hypothetical protein n=1 Tax=Methylopila sp. 73B TaxID=1120792 RepID=UPI00039E67AB|nr:hypothetical protein [Methylopila sp. 73B]
MRLSAFTPARSTATSGLATKTAIHALIVQRRGAAAVEGWTAARLRIAAERDARADAAQAAKHAADLALH